MTDNTPAAPHDNVQRRRPVNFVRQALGRLLTAMNGAAAALARLCEPQQPADWPCPAAARVIAEQARRQERRDLAERALHGGLPADMDECRVIARYRRQGRQDAGAEIADLIEHVVGEYPGNGIPRPENDQGEPLTDVEWAAWLARNAYPKEPKTRA